MVAAVEKALAGVVDRILNTFSEALSYVINTQGAALAVGKPVPPMYPTSSVSGVSVQTPPPLTSLHVLNQAPAMPSISTICSPEVEMVAPSQRSRVSPFPS